MGVDYALFDRLAELSTRFQPSGRTLMLGRQKFGIQPKFAKFFDASLQRHGIERSSQSYLQDDMYAETLMRELGFGEMEAMDFSPFENASILHDLNTKPDRSLHKKFDLIIDGGTLEHVFNVPVALEGIYRMLKPGGRFVSMTPYNGWPTHGMYQFTAELVWTFWGRACNCSIHDCRAIPATHAADESGHVILEDPAITGKRLRRVLKRIGSGRTYLYYEVEKTPQSHLPTFALQSDYETKWHGHGNAGETRLEEARGR